MSKTTSGITIMGIIFILGILLVILTWPRLSLQTKFDGGQDDFTIFYPDTAKLTVSVWNRGGSISDWRIITPESCVYANVSGNITCSHEGFSGTMPCSVAICGSTPVQDTGPTDKMSLKFNEPYPNNFTIGIYAWSSFSFIRIASMNDSYSCSLNNEPMSNSYTCR